MCQNQAFSLNDRCVHMLAASHVSTEETFHSSDKTGHNAANAGVTSALVGASKDIYGKLHEHSN